MRYRVHCGCGLLQVSTLRLEVFGKQRSLTCLLWQVCVGIIGVDRGCMGNFGGKLGGGRAHGVRRLRARRRRRGAAAVEDGRGAGQLVQEFAAVIFVACN